MNKEELEKLVKELEINISFKKESYKKARLTYSQSPNRKNKTKYEQELTSLFQAEVFHAAIKNHLYSDAAKDIYVEISDEASPMLTFIKRNPDFFDKIKRNIYYEDLPALWYTVFPEGRMEKNRNLLHQFILKPFYQQKMGIQFPDEILKQIQSFDIETITEAKNKNAQNLHSVYRFYYNNDYLKPINLKYAFGIQDMRKVKMHMKRGCGIELHDDLVFYEKQDYEKRGMGEKYEFFLIGQPFVLYKAHAYWKNKDITIKVFPQFKISLKDFVSVNAKVGYLDLRQFINTAEFRAKFSNDCQFIIQDKKDNISFFTKELFKNQQITDYLQYVFPVDYEHKKYLGSLEFDQNKSLIYKIDDTERIVDKNQPIAYLRVISRGNCYKYCGDILIYRK